MNIETKQHQGRNIKFFREAKRMKQGAFAQMLNVTQSAVAKMEQRDEIEDELLAKCAAILGISMETIKEFDVEKMFRNVTYNIEKVEGGNVGVEKIEAEEVGSNHYYPIEKIMELNKQNTELYERMLKMQEQVIAELKAK